MIYFKPPTTIPFTTTIEIVKETLKQKRILELVEEAESLFNKCNFPDKNDFLLIYNKVTQFSYIDTSVSLRIHALFFFLKIYEDIKEERNCVEKSMLERGTLQKFSNVPLATNILLEMCEDFEKQKQEKRIIAISKRKNLIDSSTEKLKALIIEFKKNDLIIETHGDNLAIYDYKTHDYYDVTNTEL